MAFISYRSMDSIPEDCRVEDEDNILRVHSIHPRVMRLHYELYLELMHRSSPLSRIQREQIAVVVSGINGCHY